MKKLMVVFAYMATTLTFAQKVQEKDVPAAIKFIQTKEEEEKH